jgi:NitT/TauT family transport system substrate-binding protein
MQKLSKRVGLVVMAISLALITVTPSFAAKMEKLTVRFTWKLKGEYAPLFVALKKGYYEKAGLHVRLAEGSGAQTVMKLLASGGENFGYGPAVAAAQAVSRGLPVKVVALYQTKAPMGVISFPDVKLSTPKDLEGKKIAISTGETFTDMLPSFAKINNFDLSKLTQIQMTNSARATQFLSRKIDVMSVYLSNELPKLEKVAKVKFNVMKVSDFGLNLVGASMIVSDDYAAKKPDVVRKLLAATGKGYRYAIAHPEEAAKIMTAAYNVPDDPEITLKQVRASLESTNVVAGKPIGWQSESDWRVTLDLLLKTGALKEVKELDAYYTNKFLQ